jgi:hypothetical protein
MDQSDGPYELPPLKWQPDTLQDRAVRLFVIWPIVIVYGGAAVLAATVGVAAVIVAGLLWWIGIIR